MTTKTQEKTQEVQKWQVCHLQRDKIFFGVAALNPTVSDLAGLSMAQVDLIAFGRIQTAGKSDSNQISRIAQALKSGF